MVRRKKPEEAISIKATPEERKLFDEKLKDIQAARALVLTARQVLTFAEYELKGAIVDRYSFLRGRNFTYAEDGLIEVKEKRYRK